ncbi:MAG: hypothetical protein N3G76_01530 [Candidatus Micrarchaeota archaeon]|nr:hypothetical protein [Candidatus Micrarchaeota archaeon]
MQKAILLMGIVLAALLLFGCIGGGDTGSQATGSGKQSGDTGTNSLDTKPQGGQQSEKGSSAFNPSVPQKCTVKDRTTGDVSMYYTDGKGNIRAEVQAGSKKMVAIVKGDTLYTQATSEMRQGIMQDCDWFSFKTGGKSTDEMETLKINTDVKAMAEAAARFDVSCTPLLPDDTLLSTPGKVCDLEKMINEARSNPCASITDVQERAECEKAIAGYK